MPIDAQQYKDVLRCFASGVTLVTTRADGGETRGMTVSAFTSVSAEPPLVAVVIQRSATITPLLTGSGGSFAVSILGAEHDELSNRFAFLQDEDRFAEGRWGEAATGSPVLEDALAWLDCRIVGHHEAGSHNIYIGQVEACRVRPEGGEPLVYWNQGYRRLVL